MNYPSNFIMEKSNFVIHQGNRICSHCGGNERDTDRYRIRPPGTTNTFHEPTSHYCSLECAMEATYPLFCKLRLTGIIQ